MRSCQAQLPFTGHGAYPVTTLLKSPLICCLQKQSLFLWLGSGPLDTIVAPAAISTLRIAIRRLRCKVRKQGKWNSILLAGVDRNLLLLVIPSPLRYATI